MKTLSDILKETPFSIKNYIQLSTRIAASIDDCLKAKGWSQKDLADKMNKRESEISKFLNGNHNFTLKSVAKLEEILETKLLYTKYDEPDNLDWNFIKLLSVSREPTTFYRTHFSKIGLLKNQKTFNPILHPSIEKSNVIVTSEGEIAEVGY